MSAVRLRSPITAVYEPPSGGATFFQVPAGTVLEIPELGLVVGLIEITYQERPVLVFMRDIHECSERLDEGSRTYYPFAAL